MRGLNVLKLLLLVFWKQPLHRKFIFAFLIVLLAIWVSIYFSAFCIWWLIKMFMSEVLLRGLEWYLIRYHMVEAVDLNKAHVEITKNQRP